MVYHIAPPPPEYVCSLASPLLAVAVIAVFVILILIKELIR